MTQIITDDPTLIDKLDAIVTHDYSGVEFDDYWYVDIGMHQCPGCKKFYDSYCTDTHDYVIWENKDDDYLLKVAIILQKIGCNVSVRQYNRVYGPCMEFYDALELDVIIKLWELGI